MKLVPLILVLAIAIAGCKSAEKPVGNVSEFNGRKLEYGSQGGVSGGGTSTVLLANGQVFTTTTIPVRETYKGQYPQKQTQVLITEGEALVKKHAGLKGVGNMTYFIAYHDGTTAHRITWTGEETEAAELRAFTQRLSQFVQSQNTQP